MKMPREVGKTPRGKGCDLRVVWENFGGIRRLHARVYYLPKDAQPADDDEPPVYKPGKGLAVPPDLVPWLRAQLEEAERLGVAAGLIRAQDYTDYGIPLPDLGGSTVSLDPIRHDVRHPLLGVSTFSPRQEGG